MRCTDKTAFYNEAGLEQHLFITLWCPPTLGLPFGIPQNYELRHFGGKNYVILTKIKIKMATMHAIDHTGAPEPRGQLPLLPKQRGGSTGATGCPFYRNCSSKLVRYSQELEFITVFKQCLSNLCLIFNQL